MVFPHLDVNVPPHASGRPPGRRLTLVHRVVPAVTAAWNQVPALRAGWFSKIPFFVLDLV